MGVIGVEVKDKNGKSFIAKAVADKKMKKGKEYTLQMWNIKRIFCGFCQGQDKKCEFCAGEGSFISFSYKIK